MALLDVFNVSGSAMSAQSVRLNVTASNLANAQSVSNSVGTTYRARHPVFAAVQADVLEQQGGLQTGLSPSRGVQVLGIVESEAPPDLRYEPDHPYADEQGYVAYPNVNVVEEMANMISASRSFQVNVQTMQAAREMATRLLTLGQ
jgi:flagellar basal-body rod protein FlgC